MCFDVVMSWMLGASFSYESRLVLREYPLFISLLRKYPLVIYGHGTNRFLD